MGIETQESIGKWAVDTFGGEPGLTPRHCIRLLEEVAELCRAVGCSQAECVSGTEHSFSGMRLHWADPDLEKVPSEMADVAIVLDTLAHRGGIDLQAEKDKKMAVNRARTWRKLGDGTGYHVKSEAE